LKGLFASTLFDKTEHLIIGIMNKLSTYLYARPSFIEGVARLIDFGGTLNEYNCSATSDQADAKAIASDWKVVGSDFKSAVKAYKKQKPLDDSFVAEARAQLMSDTTMKQLTKLK
jgi:hypothetical protein